MQLFKSLFHKPVSTQLTVTSSNGFHLRPVAQFVHRAKTFKSHLSVIFKDKTVDAKAVNTLLSLSLETDDTFRLTAKGKDAQKALNALESLFKNLMKTDKEVQEIKKETYTYVGSGEEGDIICQGIVIASTFAYKTQEIVHNNSLSFKEAITKTIKNLLQTYEAERNHTHEAEIYLAQKELLDSLSQDCESLEALEARIVTESSKLKGTKLSAKIADYQDILQQVKTTLGLEIKLLFPKEDFILLADDLLPSEITQISKSTVQGVLLKETSINSHTAILLRAAGIPSLVINTSHVPLGETIILDATAGVIILSPNEADKQKAVTLQLKEKEKEIHAADKRFEQARTPSGKKISVYANVADTESAKKAKEEGAEGIGLLRSEFLFTEQKPSLELQTKAYKAIFELFSDVTVRTLDIGGDKALPYISLPKEDNPFLGVRGIRLLQTHPELLAEQLQAIFIAAENKPIKIMFPMVSSVDEFTQAKAFALDVAKKHNIAIDNILFGMMIEVPSVLFTLAEFDNVVDFYSVGTNDLTQYLFAIERTHPTLKTDTLSPVVFTALESIVNTVTKPVSICGELASNVDAIPRLVQMGYKTLSVTGKSIPLTKETIRNI